MFFIWQTNGIIRLVLEIDKTRAADKCLFYIKIADDHFFYKYILAV